MWDLRMSRRRFLSRGTALGLALAAGPGLAACNRASAPPTPGAGFSPGRDQTARSARYTGVLPNSELAVGPNTRFLLGLLDKDNHPVGNLQVKLAFFTLTGSQIPQQARATLKFTTDATYYTSPGLGERGLYVARVSFDTPGSWGVEVQATPPDGQTEVLRLFLSVAERTATPAVGTIPPASNTPVATTPAETEKICSARPPCDMHDLSIADGLRKGRPLAVLFATPAYCTSQVCGPDLQTVQMLKAKYHEKMNFIHVEIWQDAKPGQLAPAVGEWKLPSEPWLFLMDAEGKVYDKFEGGITTQELDPILSRLAGA